MIKFLVTRERINEQMTPVEYFGMSEGSAIEQYRLMLKFMVGDDGQYLNHEQATAEMRGINMGEFVKTIIPGFVQAIRDSSVNPTSAGVSNLPPAVEPQTPPHGS